MITIFQYAIKGIHNTWLDTVINWFKLALYSVDFRVLKGITIVTTPYLGWSDAIEVRLKITIFYPQVRIYDVMQSANEKNGVMQF